MKRNGRRKEGRANDTSLARGLNVTTFPPKRNLKVGKHRALAATPSAVNETSSVGSHFQFSTAWPCAPPAHTVYRLPSHGLPSFHTTGDKLPSTFPSFHFPRLAFPESALPSFFSPAIPMQVPQQTSVRLHVFLSPPRALSTSVLPTPPPPSIPLLSLRNVDIVDSMFDMVSALNGSIGYVTASSKLVFLFFLNLQIDGNTSFNVKEDRSGRALTLILSN